MDTLPPPTPALAVNIDDVRRAEASLRATHRQLQALDDRLPYAPSDPTRRDAALRDIDLFWQATVESSPDRPPTTRRQAFVRLLARVAIDDAIWRLADGMLPTHAGPILRSLPEDPLGHLPPHMHAEELVLGDTPYAGMLMLRSDLHPDTVLLFSSHRGWMAFPSRKDLLAHAERNLRQMLASRDDLPGIAHATIEARLDGAFLSGRPLGGSFYATLAERMIRRHREKVEASLSRSDSDAFYDASTLHDLIDLRGMDIDRSSLRHALARKVRSSDRPLASYPPALRDAAIQAASDDEIAALRVTDAVIAGTIVPPKPMDTFLRDELIEQLGRLGVDDPPETIWVRSRLFPHGFLKAASALIQGRDETMVNLMDFTRWNAGTGELDTLTVVDAQGAPHPRLDTRKITAMVRTIDAGRRYVAHLDDHKGDSEQGLRYRRLARDRWLARIRLDAANARLAQHDGALSALLPDARERAYRWIEATLAHPEPSSRQSVDGDDLVVQQLTYLDATVSGVFVIAARHADVSSHVVVYTPDAPDRIAFREFRTRDDMVRHFLLDRAFEAYLLAHLPLEFTTTDANGRAHFDVTESTKTLRWALPNDGCGFCTSLAEPFAYRDVITDIADATYDTEREQERRTFRYVSRSTEQADDDATNQRYRIPHALAGMPGEATGCLVAMAAQSLTTATNSAWRLYDDLKTGNYAHAFVDAVSVYVNGLDVATLGPTPGAWSHGAIRRLTKASTARRAGLSIPVTPVDDLATTTATPSLVALAETQWPSHAYYHASPAELERLERVGMLVLLQSRLGKGDLRGVPLVVLPPGRHPPSSRYPAGWMPASAEGAPSSPGTWVRIDLREALRGTNLSANSFNVYRPIDGDGNVLVLRPGQPLPIMGGAAPLILFDHYTMESAPAA